MMLQIEAKEDVCTYHSLFSHNYPDLRSYIANLSTFGGYIFDWNAFDLL